MSVHLPMGKEIIYDVSDDEQEMARVTDSQRNILRQTQVFALSTRLWSWNTSHVWQVKRHVRVCKLRFLARARDLH